MERYFAYGSNMHGPQMAERVPDARFVTIARLAGYRLAFTGRSRFGGAVSDVIASDADEVWGVIYHLPLASLERLDTFERLYDRREVDVHHSGGSSRAWIYIVREPDLVSVLAPRSEYLSRIVQGAEAARLPDEYIGRLRAIKCHSP